MNARILYINVERRSHIEKAKFAGIKRCAAAYGWEASIIWDTQSSPEQLKRTLARLNPIGCIVESAAGTYDLPPEIFGGVPVVYLDPQAALHGGNVSRVVHDGDASARMALQALSSGRPKAYAVVGYYQPAEWSEVRMKAFVQMLAERGTPCSTFSVVGDARRRELREWIGGLPDRCAVFAVNDEVALEIARHCRTLKRRIPTSLSLIGVDNVGDVCLRTTPRLSSVHVDFELAGFKACELIHKLKLGEHGCLQEAFGPLMVVHRESTGGAGRHERRIDVAVELIRREACNGLRARDVIRAMVGSRRLSELRFREAVGHSILEEIITVRMTRVFQMLGDPEIPIEAIVRASGFATGAALRKVFFARTGLSLSAWRKRFGLRSLSQFVK